MHSSLVPAIAAVGRVARGAAFPFRALVALASLTTAAPLHAQLQSPQPYDNVQPSLGLMYFLDRAGFVRMTGATFVPDGFVGLTGGEQLISQVPAYFSSVGTTWGGNGTTTVGTPNADGRVIVGAASGMPLGSTHGAEQVVLTTANFPVSAGGSAAPFDNRQPGVVMRYAIRTSGIFPSLYPSASGTGLGVMGAVVPYAGVAALPTGWAFAEGQLLPISQNQALFSLLGTTYGGDGRTTFALPDLRGRTPIGTGNGIDIGQVSGSNFTTIADYNLPSYGGELSNHQATLGLSFLMAKTGATYPPRGDAPCPCAMSDDTAFLGEVNMFAWRPYAASDALAGQLVEIRNNTALFSLLGTTFGGDGKTTFALPDLQGRVVVGAGAPYDWSRDVWVGERFGSDAYGLLSQPPGLERPDPPQVAVPEPGTAVLTFVGLVGLLGARRRRRV